MSNKIVNEEPLNNNSRIERYRALQIVTCNVNASWAGFVQLLEKLSSLPPEQKNTSLRNFDAIMTQIRCS